MTRRNNGEGNVYLRKDGRWEARFFHTDPTTGHKKRYNYLGKTHEEAYNKMITAKAAILTGNFVEPNKMAVKDWLSYWLAECIQPNVKPTTYAQYETMARVHIVPTLGSLALQKVQTSDIQRMYNVKQQCGGADGGGLAPKTIRHIHNVIHCAFRQAVEEGKLLKNPSDAVKLPKKEKPDIRVMKLEEIRQFLNLIETHRFYPAFLLEIRLGLRRGELLGLRWQDIDFEKRILYVRQTLIRVSIPDGNGGRINRLIFQSPKSERSKRPLPIPMDIMIDLHNHKLRIEEERAYAGKSYKSYDLVFCQKDGAPLDPRGFSRLFEKLLKDAGLPKTTFHSLRHTAGMLLLASSKSLKVVQEMLGHTTIQTTADIYLDHVSVDDMDKALAQMNGILLTKKVDEKCQDAEWSSIFGQTPIQTPIDGATGNNSGGEQ
ncbi:tyrosine-type recombinase/integrase [Heliobacterium undosum]|uniref:Tyrosine-type recombinase/integrase n=1 Tax=Heliomicrobium undosum TaxID=121734 RepID=A0A845L2D4_9FIRM|nr:site-specific integrase [Heliomicrobium undosum]MZP28650.1 tyrosine-type recombinase/integrase [Heliomicrobium undosum]